MEELALSWLDKAIASNEGLRKEIEAERSLSQALEVQVEVLQKWLEDARAAGVAAAELYQSALASFGGTTSPLPIDASALGVFGWFKENLAKLPDFIRGAMDFGALSCATNLCKTLGRMGCSHFASLKGRKDLDGPSELGETSAEISKPVLEFHEIFLGQVWPC